MTLTSDRLQATCEKCGHTFFVSLILKETRKKVESFSPLRINCEPPKTKFMGTLAELDRAVLFRSLVKHGWNNINAMEELGLSSSGFYNLRRKYGITPDMPV